MVWSQSHIGFDGKHGYCSVDHSLLPTTNAQKQNKQTTENNQKWFYENLSENSLACCVDPTIQARKKVEVIFLR